MRHIFVALIVTAAAAVSIACSAPESSTPVASSEGGGEAAAAAPAAEAEEAADEAPAAAANDEEAALQAAIAAAAAEGGESPDAAMQAALQQMLAGDDVPQGEPLDPEAPAIDSDVSMLHGTWDLDIPTTLATVAADESLSEEERQFITAMMSSMRLTFEFKAGDAVTVTTTAMGQEDSTEATWSHTGSENNRHSLTMTMTAGEGEDMQTDTQNLIGHFAEPNVLHLRLNEPEAGPMQVMSFRRRQ